MAQHFISFQVTKRSGRANHTDLNIRNGLCGKEQKSNGNLIKEVVP